MKIKSSTKKYLIIAVIIFFIQVILIGVTLFRINQEKEKLTVLSNDLSIANKEDVVALKRAIRNYEASGDVVKNLLVNKDNVFDFIGEVESLAKQNGAVASVQNIELFDVLKNDELVRNTGEDNPTRTHGKLVMSIKVDGGWDSIASFLLKMENYPKHVSIEAMRLNSIFDSQTKRQTWSADFNLVTTTN